jgi:hypothetical protein
MRLVVESVCAENICAHAQDSSEQDSSEQHSSSPPGGIELFTFFSRTALYASLLIRPLHQSTYIDYSTICKLPVVGSSVDISTACK